MKIKTSIFYSLAAFALLGGAANAQSSATDPVGFHTLKVHGALVSGPRISLVAPGLINPIDYASATTGVTATTITVDGTPFTAGAFNEVAPDGAVPPAGAAGYIPYYVEVTSGPEAGAWANILSNDASSLTVDRNLVAAGQTEKIAIRRHVSIADLFGANNEAGLDGDPTGDVASADEVVLFDGSAAAIYFYVDDPAIKGWYSSSLEHADSVQIEPQQGVQVVRKQSGDLLFTRAGHVKVGPTKLGINPGLNVVANPRAVGIDATPAPVFTLGNSNLYNAGDLANSVDPGDEAANADEVTVFLDTPDFTTEIYFKAVITDPPVDGWFTTALDPADDAVIENGTAFLVDRKAPGGSFIWTVPAEPIAAP